MDSFDVSVYVCPLGSTYLVTTPQTSIISADLGSLLYLGMYYYGIYINLPYVIYLT